MLLKKIKNLPNSPGCYLFKNQNNVIIYIGKSKNLKKRIENYFSPKEKNKKTNLLISEINNLSYILTNNELEALILESNLIKKYTPKYNFKLIDDKTYPYIEITNEKHPRLKISRYKKLPPNKNIFGPFPNQKEILKQIINILYQIYPLRKCHPLEKKPCFYYHIKQCIGPCCQKKVNYQENINAIVNFFKGKNYQIFKKIKKKMLLASDNLEFEKADKYKNILINLKKILEKQFIDLKKNKNYDIIAFDSNQNEISIYILQMNNGNILDKDQIVFTYVSSVTSNILTYLNFYYQKKIIPKEIIVGQELKKEKNNIRKLLNIKVCIPTKNVKFKLYQLALKNAQENLLKYNLIYQSKYQIIQNNLIKLSEIVEKEINYIEIFDNAHLFGQSFVSSMIVFKNFKFEKKKYIKFLLNKKIKNDFEAFRNIIQKRYKKILKTTKILPDLILVDGGLAQFNTALKILKKMNVNIKLGALKKNKKHQLESLILNKKEIFLDKKSELFKFLSKLSKEVHNFTIKFHQKTKKKEDFNTLLLKIKGLGKIRYKKILEKFNNITEIKQASCEEFKKLKIPCNILEKIKKILKK
ncbi:excinuclease ABC subunit C [Candidatus Phytoplasma oryzae]|uniref:UvrABC system protein C n=1 Tax=Candidatus Phytoplasma oryzae TaxID=203274 RepID=A0A139JR78_9MOLU|nr:excinuclease ABC subunit UvrC [Candidatus Phytoplasma oryzae]KXT29344.1 excinuclease ABC subunit C [Candidatus Phytoplasma oryzae]RAM57898.1 excinuclease ABC subunit C [Candidatus Phytoplasma oryzae]